MKRLFSIVLIITTFLLSNCKKSDSTINSRPTLNALQATWTFKSSRCSQDPNIITPLLPNTIFILRSDMSAVVTAPGAVGVPFTYNLLPDDSTLITNTSGPIPDTFAIISITSTELVYHGKNTYAHTSSNCINGNKLDSLYK